MENVSIEDVNVINNKKSTSTYNVIPEILSENVLVNMNLSNEINSTLSQSDVDVTKDDRIKMVKDQGCQVEILDYSTNNCPPLNVLVSNRIIYHGSTKSDVEIQTDIDLGNKPTIVKNLKKFKDKSVNTLTKSFADISLSTDDLTYYSCKNHFSGIESIKDDEQMLDLAGVTLCNFDILLECVEEHPKWQVKKKNRLLIFFVKLKTGLTYSALSVIFGLHRTTIADIFISVLQHLCGATKNWIFWPTKMAVLKTMPECFKPDYTNVRVIIDCTEFRIEMPSSVENRVWCYSNYKKWFTAKLLIGCTPGGYICFKSKVSGGRKSDSEITIESGLLDFLEEEDEILADKGFPDIKKSIDETGKKILLIMPPFLENKSEFSKEECEATYNIARVRIHVERIMQRLKTYNVLNKIPHNLFPHIDDIMHICCVLVNLQPPIIAEEEKDE